MLNIEANNPSEKNYLKITKDLPGIHKFSEKSPLYGFTKLRNRLRDEFMERVKWTTVNEHIEEKKTLRDRLTFFRTLIQAIGAGRGMVIQQFRHLSQNKAVNEDSYKDIDAPKLWNELVAS